MIVYRSEFPMLNDLHITTLDDTPLPYFAPYLVEDGINPAWSPGGSWIAYRENFGDGISLIHPDRSDTLFVTVGDNPDWAPAVLVQSPEAGVSGCVAPPATSSRAKRGTWPAQVPRSAPALRRVDERPPSVVRPAVLQTRVDDDA